MPRFSANISTLFTDVDLPERFARAAQAGFRGVEIQFPYACDKAMLAERARGAGVEVVLINLPAGDLSTGERGIACLPSRASEFRDAVGLGIEYARALGVTRVNCLAGIAPPKASDALLRETFISNIRYAAGELGRRGIQLLIEPINTRTLPRFWLHNFGQAIALIAEASVSDTLPNIAIQYDLFHMQIMEGDLSRTMAENLPHIGHIQFADVPDRHEPGTGELNFAYLFDAIDRIGYTGWVGAEYTPSLLRTEDTLGWFRPYLLREQQQQQQQQ